MIKQEHIQNNKMSSLKIVSTIKIVPREETSHINCQIQSQKCGKVKPTDFVATIKKEIEDVEDIKTKEYTSTVSFVKTEILQFQQCDQVESTDFADVVKEFKGDKKEVEGVKNIKTEILHEECDLPSIKIEDELNWTQQPLCSDVNCKKNIDKKENGKRSKYTCLLRGKEDIKKEMEDVENIKTDILHDEYDLPSIKSEDELNWIPQLSCNKMKPKNSKKVIDRKNDEMRKYSYLVCRNEQSKKPTYKYCIVPKCRNTIRNAPDKVFFLVPRGLEIRRKWCKIMKRDMVSPSTCLYCCEDHFDVESDTHNYMEYKIMNLQENKKTTLRLKKDILPHKFQCQKDTESQPLPARKGFPKKKYLEIIEGACYK